MEQLRKQPQTVRAHLSLWDAVSIILGIVIGAGIYKTPSMVFKSVPEPWMALAIWAVAGFLCLIGALCYAELASTYPRLGGDYVYLSRAYGAGVGFLYGWTQLAVIQSASIGMMAYVFADYAVQLWDFGPYAGVTYALAAVAGLSLLNLLGVVLGKGAQNILTAAKVLGLGGILAAGFWGAQPHAPVETHAAVGFAAFFASLAGAFVPVFLTYGGWNDAAFVAAELRRPRRNIPLALILGTAGITVIYLLVNAAYLASLGFEQARQSQAIAADVLAIPFGGSGYRVMCVLVMISALGAVNGLIFTSSRIYAKLGSEHRLFAWLGRWNPRVGSPVGSLLTQAVISLALIAVVGIEAGRSALSTLFEHLGFEKLDWAGYGGFETLLRCTAPVFWFFFLLTGLSLFILRLKDRGIERPFTVPLFPIVPLVFCATCGYMLYASILYAWKLGLVGGALAVAGLPLYLLSRRQEAPGLLLDQGPVPESPVR